MSSKTEIKDKNITNLIDYVCGVLHESQDKHIILYGWLNEQNLQNLLYKIFGAENVIARHSFKGTRYIPDFVLETHKLVIEFDGSRHYTEHASAVNDVVKDETYKSLGYKVLRIPYFVQIQYADLKAHLNPQFLPEYTFTVEYPQGFVHPKCALPADFCEAGLKRFSRDLQQYSQYKDGILASLALNNRPDLTLPESLKHLLPPITSIADAVKGKINRWKYFFKHGLKVQGIDRSKMFEEKNIKLDIRQSCETVDRNAFYALYRQLEGKKTQSTYETVLEHLDYLYVKERTDEAYIGSSLGLMLFYYLVGSYEEGERIRRSVDMIAPIT